MMSRHHRALNLISSYSVMYLMLCWLRLMCVCVCVGAQRLIYCLQTIVNIIISVAFFHHSNCLRCETQACSGHWEPFVCCSVTEQSCERERTVPVSTGRRGGRYGIVLPYVLWRLILIFCTQIKKQIKLFSVQNNCNCSVGH